jgi:hypothetical protein
MRGLCAVLLAAVALMVAGCTMTSRATEFNGLTDFGGDKVTHLNTTNVAVHLLFKDPIWGDASLEQTVDDLTSEAKASGATKVRIVQSDRCTYWWVLPPISFVIHPVVGNAAADVR